MTDQTRNAAITQFERTLAAVVQLYPNLVFSAQKEIALSITANAVEMSKVEAMALQAVATKAAGEAIAGAIRGLGGDLRSISRGW